MSPARSARQPAENPAEAADALLADVEPLPYPRRMRELALRARGLAGTPPLAALLTELSARGRYERRTALHLAMAARDFGHIAAVLAGPDMDLRRAALRAVRTLPVPDESAEAVLDDAPSALRRAFYRTLLHSGRRALADRLLPQVRERWGDREAAVLLPACSGPVVAEALPGLAHAVGAWRTLGGRHPHAVLDAAEADLDDVPVRWRWWGRHGAGIEAAAPHVPERVLSLLERTRDIPGAARLTATFGVLMKTDPARTGPLLLETSWRRFPGLYPSVRAYLRSCSLDDAVARVPVGSYPVYSYLEALPPGRREAVFDAVVERDQHIGDGLQVMPILQLLPPERSAAEARRMLAWHSSTWHSARARLDDPQIPLKLQAFLPYEEAAGPLREAAFFGDARRRSLARSLWVECASRTGDRAVLAEVVSELALRSVNEQDPVRASLLGTLAGLRPAHLDDGLAEPFARLAIAAIESRDSSPGTRRILRLLAARVLRHAEAPALVEWAMDVYVRLMARYGADGLAPAEMAPESRRRRARGRRVPVADDHRLDRVLRRGQEDDLLDRLRPHMEAARLRGDFSLAVGLARSLGRRAYRLPELQEDLRAAIVQRSGSQSREAADLWLAERGTREDRAVGVFRADPAIIVHPRVWAVIAGRRTDLLATIAQGGAPWDWAPAVTSGTAGRWTPGQREHVGRLLAGRAVDQTLPIASRLAAVASLGGLPGTLDDLTDWAGRPDDVIAEAALDALSRSEDALGALRVLLAHGRGLASSTAVAAMGRCCPGVPPSSLGVLLGEALTGPGSKVTVRKQAARLLERHRPPGAADVLLRAWRDADLHRDVRVAVAVALRHMPATPGAFEALDEAAERYASEPMLRTLFQAQPWEYAPEYRPRYAALVWRLLNAAQAPGVRFRGIGAFRTWVHWYEGGTSEILTSVADPGDPAGARDLSTFLSFMHAGLIHDEVPQVIERLLAEGRDAEARRRLSSLVGALLVQHRTDRYRDLSGRVAALLAGHPLYLGEALRLDVHYLPVDDDGAGGPALAEAFVSLAGRLRDRPVLAARVSGHDLGRRLRVNGACRIPPKDLLSAARRLLDESHLGAELLALALAGFAVPEGEPGEDWNAILDGLRGSAHLDVAVGAWEIECIPRG